MNRCWAIERLKDSSLPSLCCRNQFSKKACKERNSAGVVLRSHKEAMDNVCVRSEMRFAYEIQASGLDILTVFGPKIGKKILDNGDSNRFVENGDWKGTDWNGHRKSATGWDFLWGDTASGKVVLEDNGKGLVWSYG
jgi:hypothetical protein